VNRIPGGSGAASPNNRANTAPRTSTPVRKWVGSIARLAVGSVIIFLLRRRSPFHCQCDSLRDADTPNFGIARMAHHATTVATVELFGVTETLPRY